MTDLVVGHVMGVILGEYIGGEVGLGGNIRLSGERAGILDSIVWVVVHVGTICSASSIIVVRGDVFTYPLVSDVIGGLATRNHTGWWPSHRLSLPTGVKGGGEG